MTPLLIWLIIAIISIVVYFNIDDETPSVQSTDGISADKETNDEIFCELTDVYFSLRKQLKNYIAMRRMAKICEKRLEKLKKGELCFKSYRPQSSKYTICEIQRVKETAERSLLSNRMADRKFLSTVQKRLEKVLEEVKKIPIYGKGRREARLAVKKVMQCPICLETKRSYSLLELNCSHHFCKGCLASHLELSNRCPYCRALIESVHGDHDYKLGWEGKKMIVNILPYEESQ